MEAGLERSEPRLVDADSHFIEPLTWLDEVDPGLASQLPAGVSQGQFTEILFSELLSAIPEEHRPPMETLLSPGLRRRMDATLHENEGHVPLSEMEQRIREGPLAASLRPKGSRGGVERLELCDQHGISVQLISPTTALGSFVVAKRARPDLHLSVVKAYNTWAAEQLSGYTDRLVPVTVLDFVDVHWAVGELERMRGLGSRAFLFPLDPVDGRSLEDPDFDPIWAAAVDLGMIALMHVGFGRVHVDPGWARVGARFSPTSIARMVMTHTPLIPQLALAALIYSGVFDRHPEFAVVCQEFGLSWVEEWIDRVGPASRDGKANFSAVFGWDLKRLPAEYVGSNVFFSPLSGDRADQLLDALGASSAVFATDYPHPEGSLSARDEFGSQLADARFAEARAGFFGGTMEALLARGR